MSENSLEKPSRLVEALANRLPKLNSEEIEAIQSRLMDYIADGLDDGYTVGLIKRMNQGEDNEELKIKTLNLFGKRR